MFLNVANVQYILIKHLLKLFNQTLKNNQQNNNNIFFKGKVSKYRKNTMVSDKIFIKII